MTDPTRRALDDTVRACLITHYYFVVVWQGGVVASTFLTWRRYRHVVLYFGWGGIFATFHLTAHGARRAVRRHFREIARKEIVDAIPTAVRVTRGVTVSIDEQRP